jgi:hypothetical protein
MDQTENIILYDEDGNPEEYELIDIFELGGNVYGGFAPAMTESNANDDELEIVMLKVVETDDGEAFSEIEDPGEEEAAFDELVRREDMPY